ncbi:formylglycine-generating enzyme required for sulfatase activity [Pseudoduganella flava]|uniref:Formylglycine-generating enzyme required for sulfatase activity n=1 Tax=Pseudoduganella flava TaxID=871742 RepID=A0A562PBM7_9BURK|nr:formylglycine-generating enzyme family protein [Pseudoduganella flava]QGZ37997.1 SUMF1/EgtB/PvdO family nonheme iron enzyme [Pseudoduganella flava]TWI41819.1 formylglycine-generating enzyme required for sulfatase activity [Pseudoduganella flava]
MNPLIRPALAAAVAVGTAAAAAVVMAATLATDAAAAEYVPLPGGPLRSVVPADQAGAPVQVAPFRLRDRPVTNSEFRAFTVRNPEWSRAQAPALFAGTEYLATLDKAADDAPVTHVSWYAAQAYCASEGARLPRWHEWEMAAAADATRLDARDDPAWLSGILSWYATPATTPAAVARGTPSAHGVYDLHGLIWEWVEDYNGLFVDADSRSGARKTLEFCGAAAASLSDRRNYAILIRVALLAALEANHDGPLLGFRCARDEGVAP